MNILKILSLESNRKIIINKEANLIPARADGIVYMDNKPVYNKYVLKNKDILEIGDSKFIYVDFLNECKKYLNDFEYEDTDNEDKERLTQKEKRYRKLKKKSLQKKKNTGTKGLVKTFPWMKKSRFMHGLYV